MATHGVVGPFVQGHKDWVSYAECLHEYFAANDIKAATKQHAILFSSCGAVTYHACGKTGHIARACHSKGNTQSREQGGKKHSHGSVQRTHQLTAEDKQDETSYAFLQLSAPREAPIQMTVMLDHAEVAMEVDTGRLSQS